MSLPDFPVFAFIVSCLYWPILSLTGPYLDLLDLTWTYVTLLSQTLCFIRIFFWQIFLNIVPFMTTTFAKNIALNCMKNLKLGIFGRMSTHRAGGAGINAVIQRPRARPTGSSSFSSPCIHWLVSGIHMIIIPHVQRSSGSCSSSGCSSGGFSSGWPKKTKSIKLN